MKINKKLTVEEQHDKISKFVEQEHKLVEKMNSFIQRLKIIANCSAQQKFYLAEMLNKMEVKTCFTGNSIGDSFALDQSFVSITTYDCATDFTKEKSNIILNSDLQLLLECVKFGRNIL